MTTLRCNTASVPVLNRLPIGHTGPAHSIRSDPDKPETLLIVAREFRAADRLTSELTGFSPVALLDEDVADLFEEAL